MINFDIKILKMLFAFIYASEKHTFLAGYSRYISLPRIPGTWSGGEYDVAEEALNGRNKTRRKVRITNDGKMLEMRTANVEYYIYVGMTEFAKFSLSNPSVNHTYLCTISIYIHAKMTYSIHTTYRKFLKHFLILLFN